MEVVWVEALLAFGGVDVDAGVVDDMVEWVYRQVAN